MICTKRAHKSLPNDRARHRNALGHRGASLGSRHTPLGPLRVPCGWGSLPITTVTYAD